MNYQNDDTLDISSLDSGKVSWQCHWRIWDDVAALIQMDLHILQHDESVVEQFQEGDVRREARGREHKPKEVVAQIGPVCGVEVECRRNPIVSNSIIGCVGQLVQLAKRTSHQCIELDNGVEFDGL